MDPLAAVFLEQSPGARDAGEPELARALAELVARGRQRWPDLPLPAAELVAHAARKLGDAACGSGAAAAIAALQAEDLFLACACTRGIRGAAEAFEQTCLGRAELSLALARAGASEALADEVRQRVREKLLVGKQSAPARIGDYSGRGSLAGWVRAVAVRLLLDLHAGEVAAPAGDAMEGPLAAGSSPELRYLKALDGRAFQDALGAAIDTLDDEQCNLVRLAYVDGVRTAQIAVLFQVDRSTIKRRLSACRQKLVAETRRLLADRLRLSQSELESLGDLVQSQLHLSLERLLRKP